MMRSPMGRNFTVGVRIRSLGLYPASTDSYGTLHPRGQMLREKLAASESIECLKLPDQSQITALKSAVA